VRPPLRSVLQVAGGAVVLVGVVAWLSGSCGRKIAPGESAPRTESAAPAGPLAPVRAVSEEVTEQASGTVASSRHTTVSSKILARIDDIRVRAGDPVEAGDVLVVLDARDLQAREREAQDAATAARSRLALARTELERVQKLFASGVASRRDLDRVVSDDQVAEAEAQRAGQRVQDTQVAVSHAEIRAPVGGVVVDRLAQPGDTAAPGVPLLRIYDPKSLRLEAPVRESLAEHLAVGQHVHVWIDAVHARMDAEIEEIVPQAEPGARTFLVKAGIPPDARIFAGMFGRLEVPAGHRERLEVPAAAVDRIGQLSFVTAVGEGGHTERRLVTTGAEDESGNVEVLSGLQAGEQVQLPPPAPGRPAG
jgi:membrane fusion protein (multidrug efflux system)